jgi:hypothetical protein
MEERQLPLRRKAKQRFSLLQKQSRDVWRSLRVVNETRSFSHSEHDLVMIIAMLCKLKLRYLKIAFQDTYGTK